MAARKERVVAKARGDDDGWGCGHDASLLNLQKILPHVGINLITASENGAECVVLREGTPFTCY